jgi:ribosomal protein L31
MKPGIHPDYHPVVYRDSSTGEEFLTRSTATSAQTVTYRTLRCGATQEPRSASTSASTPGGSGGRP